MTLSARRRSSGFTTLALLLAPFASAAPTPDRVAFSVAAPAPTPTFVAPPAPVLLEASEYAEILAALNPRALEFETEPDFGLLRRKTALGGGNLLAERATASACLDSTATDVTINSLFYYGGAGTIVTLCPGATIQLNTSIFFTDEYQQLITQGLPTDDTRATVVVANSANSNAIYGACDKCQYIAIRNIQVDGARPTLGWLGNGIGLLELGGNTNGQIVDSCHIFEPRGWTALHGIEGYQLDCSNMTISNNEVGPSGNSPNTGSQFRRRRDTTYGPGELTASVSRVKAVLYKETQSPTPPSSSTFDSALIGGIVVFQAPGSLITGNTIISNTRVLLGGINAVDFGPFGGGFTGTVVEGNTIIANTDMIKIGIALGGVSASHPSYLLIQFLMLRSLSQMSWGSDNRTASRNFDGVFRDNTFKSGPTGYFGYAMTVAGHENATVTGNDASGASFGGDPSVSCIPNPMVPTSQAFVFDQWTTPGYTLQDNFVDQALVFLICQQPGAVIASGPASPLGSSTLGRLPPVAALSSSSATSSSVSASSSALSSSSSASSSSIVSSSSIGSSSSFASSSSKSALSTVSSSTAATSTSASSTATPTPTAVLANAAAAPRKSIINERRISAASVASAIAAEKSAIAARKKLFNVRVTKVARAAATLQKRRLSQRGSPVAQALYTRATPTIPEGMVNPFEALEVARAAKA
ncbi:hypothetical protein P7C70_g469, partial [Phenoliferia sp. Uapishka_3]